MGLDCFLFSLKTTVLGQPKSDAGLHPKHLSSLYAWLHRNFPHCSPMGCPMDNLLCTHRTNSGTHHSELTNWVPLPSPEGDPPPSSRRSSCVSFFIL